MFIDRKINGALIRALAPRGGVEGVGEPRKEGEDEKQRKERIRHMRIRGKEMA